MKFMDYDLFSEIDSFFLILIIKKILENRFKFKFNIKKSKQ